MNEELIKRIVKLLKSKESAITIRNNEIVVNNVKFKIGKQNKILNKTNSTFR